MQLLLNRIFMSISHNTPTLAEKNIAHPHQINTVDGSEFMDDALRMYEQPFDDHESVPAAAIPQDL